MLKKMVAVLLWCLLSPPALAQYKFYEWTVEASFPPNNPPLCTLTAVSGQHQFMVAMWLGPERDLVVDIRKSTSIWNSFMDVNWGSVKFDTVITFDLDGKKWAVPFNYDAGHTQRVALELISPNHKVMDVQTDLMPQIAAERVEDGIYRAKVLNLLSQHKRLTVTDEAGIKTLATFSLTGFSDAYQSFNRCTQSDGKRL